MFVRDSELTALRETLAPLTEGAHRRGDLRSLGRGEDPCYMTQA